MTSALEPSPRFAVMAGEVAAGAGRRQGAGPPPVSLLRSSPALQVRLHEPQPLVDPARDLREEVGRIQVTQVIRLLDGLPRRLAERRQRRGQGLDMAAAV